ncbi:hypothetical protein WJX84_011026 [Apatococcus fuscideae]|uniref:Mitochondrial import inner membrane translocase subunit n=1 Tax=Apatococcus fuscideae TaxID=2026836 RepID=A0AAW1TJP9_9CHLO
MNSAMEGMEDLPEAQRNALLQKIEELQVRDSLRTYNSVVERCFVDCVSSFRSKNLDSTEERCVTYVLRKVFEACARVGMRFGEMSSQSEQQMQQMMAATGTARQMIKR